VHSSLPDPSDVALARFTGTVLIVAPHMDDEALACGGLLAQLPDPRRVHVVYATDGMRSPAPVVPLRDAITDDLGRRRQQESIAAMDILGVPANHLHFLGLPEGRLASHESNLARLLAEQLRDIAPDVILAPFRFDRHPDHLAVNRTVTAAVRSGAVRATLYEYFVYHRWRLLPGRDLRRYVREDQIVRVGIGHVATRKRAALDCFETQTTRFYPWQTRPILQPELIDEECSGAECYVHYDPTVPGAAIFVRGAAWIRIAHRLEPLLQRWKYRVTSWSQRTNGRTP
jgi:LmbE family N-acetylglucosaminyl deacetylase